MMPFLAHPVQVATRPMWCWRQANTAGEWAESDADL